jgi:hypothetical protein
MTDLAHDLTVRAHETARTKRDLLTAALDAARAASATRGAKLVHLAGAMRDHERHDDALALLDLVDSWFEDPATIRAAFTCAIAVHGDRAENGEDGAVRIANVLCDEERERGHVDVKFLRAEIRARQAWLAEGGEEAAHVALRRAEAELASLLPKVVS